MCLGGSPQKDNSAKIARQQEEAKQARVAAGQKAIDTNFAGFDDNYFNKIATDYKAFYNPQLDDQYADARRAATLNLAENGNLDGSAAGDAYGKVTKQYALSQGQIADSAQDKVNQLRTTVAQNKSNLYDQNRSAADPSSAAAMAAASATNLQGQQSFSPLADAFAGVINSFTTQAALKAASKASGGDGISLFLPSLGKGQGTGKLVG